MVAARGMGDCLILDFDGGETLRVWHPWGVTASEIDFRIQGASRVRWEWFSCGREQTPGNRRDIEHVRAGNGTTVCSDVP